MNSLNLSTWNCTGIMSSAYYLSNLLSCYNIHICGISEHWLSIQNIHFIDSIHPAYACMARAGKVNAANSCRGGVALLWKKELNGRITPLDINYDSILGVQLQLSQHEYIYIIHVYSPCSNYSIWNYRDHLDQLQDLVSFYSTKGRVIVILIHT